MKKQRLSLKGVKNVLSRSEMKQIMAGSAPGPNCCWCNNGTVLAPGGSSASNTPQCMSVCAADHLSGGVWIATRCMWYKQPWKHPDCWSQQTGCFG